MDSTETAIPSVGVSTTGSINTTPQVQTSERRCENPDCNVNKLISMVPKRKSTQFISEPKVMDKPILVNGFTSVFQVEGQSAKLMDIKNPNGDPNTKPIFRIVPNSHVHVVNYVVVDTDESYLKKITNNEPATMQKLLTTQKDSADQMLRKIMNGQGSTATAASTTVVSTVNPPAQPPPPNQLNRSMGGDKQALASLNTAHIPTMTTAKATSTTTPAPVAAKIHPNTSINLPVRMHPNLKITAVASAETGGTTVPLNTTASNAAAAMTHPTPPFIQPIPLANLQSPTASSVAAGVKQLTKPAVMNIQSKPVPVGGPSSALNVPEYAKYAIKLSYKITDTAVYVCIGMRLMCCKMTGIQPAVALILESKVNVKWGPMYYSKS